MATADVDESAICSIFIRELVPVNFSLLMECWSDFRISSSIDFVIDRRLGLEGTDEPTGDDDFLDDILYDFLYFDPLRERLFFLFLFDSHNDFRWFDSLDIFLEFNSFDDFLDRELNSFDDLLDRELNSFDDFLDREFNSFDDDSSFKQSNVLAILTKKHSEKIQFNW